MRIGAVLITVGLAVSIAGHSQSPKGCPMPEARQFDFWVGDWDATWKNPDGTIAKGANKVDAELDGCTVHEHFTGAGAQPLVGRSYSVYSPQKKKWQQTWVDNTGGYLDLIGEFADGKMILMRDGILGNGRPGKQRMVYSNIAKDQFDWDWESSEDGGSTWVNRWHIHYTRK